mgnify:CR=1 FL=1
MKTNREPTRCVSRRVHIAINNAALAGPVPVTHPAIDQSSGKVFKALSAADVETPEQNSAVNRQRFQQVSTLVQEPASPVFY